MVEITIIADIPLFHTVAQTSATFVAIVAGFYTLKIVTLSNDKRRFLQRIKELDNELQAKGDLLNSLKETQTSIVKVDDEELIDAYIEAVSTDFFAYEQIRSFEALRDWYNEHYEPLTANQERILKEKAPAVLEELEKLRIKRKESSTLKIKRFSSDDISLNPMIDGSIDSSLADQLANQTERNQLHELRQKIRVLEAENQGSQKMKNYYEQEYRSIAYPNNIIFGLVSLIIFAVIGVIFPLTYEWWVIPLFSYYGYDYNVNLLVVILFVAGLSITLVYIGAELYDAISLGKTKNKKPANGNQSI